MGASLFKKVSPRFTPVSGSARVKRKSCAAKNEMSITTPE